MTPKLAIDLSLWADECHERLKLEKAHVQKMADIEVQLVSAELAATAAENQRLRDTLQKESRKTVPWYRGPEIGVLVGIVGTAVVIYAAR